VARPRVCRRIRSQPASCMRDAAHVYLCCPFTVGNVRVGGSVGVCPRSRVRVLVLAGCRRVLADCRRVLADRTVLARAGRLYGEAAHGWPRGSTVGDRSNIPIPAINTRRTSIVTR
jgi:hypothetical protein